MTESIKFYLNPISVKGVVANNSSGSTGEVLTSNGSSTYWALGPSGFTGSKGDTGSQGTTGFTGSQGVQGNIGFTGSASTVAGPSGFTGSQGIQGNQGTSGTTGFTGSQGIQGNLGFTGSQGGTGTTGFTGSQGLISHEDNRIISPSEGNTNNIKFGFTSWDNNNSPPYSDFLHLRSYNDSSGGSDNLISFKRNGFGIKQWQQTFGSTSPYALSVEYWHTGNFDPAVYASLSGAAFTGAVLASQLTVRNDATAGATVKYSFSTTGEERAFISLTGASGEMRYSAGYAGYGGFSTFYTAGAERMRIDASGNVGIGATTLTPIYGRTIQVGDGSTNSSISLLGSGVGMAGDGYMAALANEFVISARPGTSLVLGSGDLERMRIDASGNLNVGQTTSALQSGGSGISIFGSTASEIKLLNTSTGQTATDGTALVCSGNGFNINNREIGEITLGTSNIARMIIGSAGEITASVDFRAPIFYDSQNTAYYLDPANTGQSLKIAGSIASDGDINISKLNNNAKLIMNPGPTALYSIIEMRGVGNSLVGGLDILAGSQSAVFSADNFVFRNAAQSTNYCTTGSAGNLTITGGLGYGSGSGGSVTQITSRTTSVTLNKTNGAITLVSAAGTTAWQSFTVTNSTVAATDVIIVNQKSGTDQYVISVTAIAAGSFRLTFQTTGGTTTEQPVFNFAIIKGVVA